MRGKQVSLNSWFLGLALTRSSILPTKSTIVSARTCRLKQSCLAGSSKETIEETDTIASGSLAHRRRSRHVNVHPHPGPIKAKVCMNEQASTAWLSIVSVSNTVLHVSHCTRELRKVEFWTIDRGEAEVSRQRSSPHHSCLPAGRVREGTGMIAAVRYALSPGKSGHVQHNVTFQIPGSVGDSVRQHQTAFSISVVDFNCLSRIHCVHIVRSSSLRSNRILGKAQNCMKGVREAIGNGNFEGAQDSCCSSAIALHARHCSLTLDGQTTGVVHDPLAHPGNGLLGGGWSVGEHHQSRRMDGSLADPPDATKPTIPQLLPPDDGRSDPQLAGNLDRLLGEGIRVHFIAWGVNQTSSQLDRLAGTLKTLDVFLGQVCRLGIITLANNQELDANLNVSDRSWGRIESLSLSLPAVLRIRSCNRAPTGVHVLPDADQDDGFSAARRIAPDHFCDEVGP